MADLSANERSILEQLLPSTKPAYRSLLDRLLALEFHRGRTLIFGPTTEVDYDLEPVALGEVTYPDGSIEPIVLSAEYDRSTFVLDPGELEHARLRWTYSTWQSGNACPKTGAPVREIPISGLPYLLVLSEAASAVWLHDTASGFNRLLSITGIYQHLLQVSPGHQSGATLSHKQFFVAASASNDESLREALIRYNKQARLFRAEEIVVRSRTSQDIIRRILHWFGWH